MELGTSFNRFADWLCSGTVIARILDNPFYMAIMLTVIIVIIIIMHKRGGGDIRFATYFYIFCAIVGTLFVYHRRFEKKSRASVQGSDIQRALSFNSTTASPDDVNIDLPYRIQPGNPFDTRRVETI